MATAASPVSDDSPPLENIECINKPSVPNCLICCTEFDAVRHRPKIIPCGHTFCKACLHVLGTEFECPLCRKEISLSDQGIMELQTDFLVLQKSCRPKDTPTNQRPCKQDVEKEFSDTVTSINNKLKSIEKELFCSETLKSVALESVDAHFDHLIHIANRRRQLLKNQIQDMHKDGVENIEKQMEKFTLSLMCLDTLQKNLSDVLEGENSENFLHNVSSEISEITENLKDIDLGKNKIEFFTADMDSKEIGLLFRKQGRLRNQEHLPNVVSLQEKQAVVALPSHIHLKVADFQGSPILYADKPDKSHLSFNILDQNNKEVSFDMWCKEDGVLLTFTPCVAGKYLVCIYFCNHLFEKLEFEVEKMKPSVSCSFGADTTQEDGLKIESPHAVCSDVSEGSVYITDVSLGSLVKLNKRGKFQWSKRIVDKNMETVFDAVIQDDTLFCTAGKLEHADEFDFEYQAMVQLCEGEHVYLLDSFSKSAADYIGNRKMLISNSPNENCTVDTLLWYNVHGYTCVNKDGRLLFSDIDEHKLLLTEKGGSVIKSVRYDDFSISSPTFLCAGQNDDIYISDIGAGNIKVLSADLSHLLQEYSSCYEEPEKSLSPTGVIACADAIFIADSFSKTVSVIGKKGKLVPYEIHGRNCLPCCPWSLALGLDGHVWVVDKENQTVSSYYMCLVQA